MPLRIHFRKLNGSRFSAEFFFCIFPDFICIKISGLQIMFFLSLGLPMQCGRRLELIFLHCSLRSLRSSASRGYDRLSTTHLRAAQISEKVSKRLFTIKNHMHGDICTLLHLFYSFKRNRQVKQSIFCNLFQLILVSFSAYNSRILIPEIECELPECMNCSGKYFNIIN